MATWRLIPRERAKGISFQLQRGRGRDRVTLTLGVVERRAAERAREMMQTEEDRGSVVRVLRLYNDEPANVTAFLIGDQEADRLLGPSSACHAIGSLRGYVEKIYGPWRAKDRPRTWVTEERAWHAILLVIGDVQLGHVDEFLVANYLDEIVVRSGPRQGQPASGNTKRIRRAAIQALLNRAYRLQHIDRLPKLSTFRLRDSTRRVRRKPDPLTLDELSAMLKVSSPMHRAMWAVGAGQGLRPSELCRVHWEDVDWASETLEVRGTKTYGSAEVVPLTPIARRELAAWWESRERPAEGHAFLSRLGTPYTSQGYRKPLATAARRAGVGRPINPNLLRDSFATIAWSVGIELDVARRILRHTDEAMLRRVYCRPRPADLVERVRSFDWAP